MDNETELEEPSLLQVCGRAFIVAAVSAAGYTVTKIAITKLEKKALEHQAKKTAENPNLK